MTYKLTIEPTGDEIDVEEGQTILDAALRAGVWLPHACGHGLCGTCKVEVLEGEVDHGAASDFALMDFEREAGKTLCCTATMDSDVTIEAEIDEEPDARVIPVRDFSATVERLDDLTHDVKGLVLALDAPIDFQAGQYINLTVPGVEGARAFSIANPPSATTVVDLHVRLVPGGAATPVIHSDLKVGDRLTFSGPYGRFFVRKSQPGPLLFMAGGTGLSSPRSMILDLLAEGCPEAITLIHGVRTQADLYGREEMEALAEVHGTFTYVPALSNEPADSGWEGARGFVHDVAQSLTDGMFAGYKAYLCGPPPMVEACIRTLMKGRLFEQDIFTEKFLTAKDAEEKPRSPVFRRL
ncbi:MAG: 2Fe-2S iron-sulfur cluster binding domain-containing protein [Rhodospirillum sp.]|nr:2Fe-2S iron-sulfur cluster binding domain-containing protein [Rhodospirillum sp.]MCF8488746.1 2Fe-2S iron-sulfur cluster binding domain-containing protein [Rhodospirillum sp.]MCF8501866.1 2Fe-2S iron-sulfur cluster binding domain-containing protein [Rhodospirillum sp.]